MPMPTEFDQFGRESSPQDSAATAGLADTHAALPAGLFGMTWLLVSTAVLLTVGGWLFTRGGSPHPAASHGAPTGDRPRRWSNRVVDPVSLSRPADAGSDAAHRRRSRSLQGSR